MRWAKSLLGWMSPAYAGNIGLEGELGLDDVRDHFLVRL